MLTEQKSTPFTSQIIMLFILLRVTHNLSSDDLNLVGASVIHGIHSLGAGHQMEGLFWTYTGKCY